MNKYLVLVIGAFLLIGCQSDEDKSIQKVELKVNTNHSGEPNITVGTDGSVYLSWVEYANDSLDVLQFSKLENDSWSEPKVIAQGEDWFVNWADFPSLVNVDSSYFTAHWLQKSAEGTYDYDVRISQSKDQGNSWSPSMIPHTDGIIAEHGFVSLLPTPEGKTFAVWLDGRNTKKEENNAMTLRSAEIDKDGKLSNEVELDGRVCDCCQTGATWTKKGPIVVYRDRSEDEIRDIGIVRKVNGEWTEPSSLFDDRWKIAGCPVNGPAIDCMDNTVVVGWFTMSEENPKVLAAISRNYGESFSDPICIDNENPIGRVDVVTLGEESWIIWMSSNEDEANINLASIDLKGKLSPAQKIGINSSSRSSGFPRMVVADKNLILAWTDATDSLSVVRTFKIGNNAE